ncbi:NAD(P)/FAD-dependent oxidoreductase [Actinokineospora sp. NBRC 105648]|uniref:protoporphyrinogen/coproporphyrinogen oxidase n=1 Tax=Actinokineospora sp. NBRC 105648 TaxID=3032206 RepID=UPI0024A1BB67|nr:NAD(P)/FAD-dependent oxidoreductase [Actinokineospora sp. NBRC 105648]GLZ36444.1 oxidoreductase [Actinokineospora sp. NBRC 105648]
MSADLDVAVVGAGIAGLALAHRLRARGRSVHVFEAADQIGGRMTSLRRDGYLIDTGAEMIGTTGYPATWRLIREFGLSDVEVPLIGADLAVWREGRPRPHVGDPRGLAEGAGLSLSDRVELAKLLGAAALRRRAYDPDTPEGTPMGGRTVAEIARGGVHDYLLQPLSGGFFGWDTERACAGPLLSHLLAVGATKTFRTYRDGMDTIARLLAARLDVSTGVAVREVTTTGSGARITIDGASLTARTVVLAVPAPVAARLHPGAPEYVRRCEFRPMAKVICLLDRPLEGLGRSFALAVPAVENPVLAGVVFDDRKHPGRAPARRGMLTLVSAPGVTGELLSASDDEIARTLLTQAERYVPGLAATLRATVVLRFPHGLPMPTPAALALRPEFVRRPAAAVEYAGDWYALRPSSESAVRSAEVVADRLAGADLAVAGA